MVSSYARTKEASQAKYISILNIIQGEVDPTQVSEEIYKNRLSVHISTSLFVCSIYSECENIMVIIYSKSNRVFHTWTFMYSYKFAWFYSHKFLTQAQILDTNCSKALSVNPTLT